MIGMDLIEINRVEKGASNMAFFLKVFSEGERAYFVKKGKKGETLAGIWAAKEAVAKAIGLGFNRGFSYNDIEVVHDEVGAPSVVLSEKAEPFFSKFSIYITITHNQTSAAAVCLLLPKNS